VAGAAVRFFDSPGLVEEERRFCRSVFGREFRFGNQAAAPTRGISCAWRNWWLSVALPKDEDGGSAYAAISAAVIRPAGKQ